MKNYAIRNFGNIYCGISIFALLSSLSISHQACAQNVLKHDAASHPEIDEIVVRAQKRDEKVQDIPIAISVVQASRLQAVGVTDSAMLSVVSPGVTIHQTGQSFQPHIRGVGTAAFGAGVENPVALYVDNVYIASQIQGIVDLVDVSQVAILKGPQGTLFGRNATGGVIQLTTREPKAEFGGEARTELDQFLTSRTNLYVTGGLANGVSANLSLGYATQGDGWGKNLLTGDDTHKINNYYSARGKLKVELGANTEMRLAGDYSDKDDSIGGNYRTVPGTQHFLDLPAPTPDNPYDTVVPFPGRTRSHGGGASMDFEHDLGFATFRSTTAYRGFTFRTDLDSGFGPVPLIDIRYTQKGRQISEEAQLVSPDGQALKWVIGGYYLNGRDIVDNADVGLHGPFAQFVPFVTNDYITRTNGKQTVNSISAFGQATIPLGAATNLTLGARFTHESRKRVGYGQSSVDGAPFVYDDAITGFPTPDIADATVIGKQSANRVTWRVALDQKLAEHVMAYASYNRGFKSGGFNLFRVDAPSYRPESIDAFEAGLKSELADRRITLNISGFYNTYRDIQVQKFIGPSAVVVNGAKARFYGVDIDTQIALSNELHFNGGLEWLHARFTDYPDADFFYEAPGFGIGVLCNFDPVACPNPSPVPPPADGAKGKHVPYAPAFTFNASLTWTKEFARGKLEATVSDSYTGRTYTEPSNRLQIDPYHLVSGNVTFTSIDDRVSVSVWGRNLLNEAVPTLIFAVTPLGFGQDFAAPPRTYGVTLKYRFGAN
jgi:iron complex outermembrane receptor protein